MAPAALLVVEVAQELAVDEQVEHAGVRRHLVAVLDLAPQRARLEEARMKVEKIKVPGAGAAPDSVSKFDMGKS